MSNVVVVLNVLVVLGLVVSAVLASELENLLSASIALAVTGLFAAAEFVRSEREAANEKVSDLGLPGLHPVLRDHGGAEYGHAASHL